MTLNQQNRSRLTRYITAYRTDWQDAGVEAALVALSQQIPDPFDVATIAIAWARRPDARTPAGMLHPELRADVTTPSVGWKTRPGPACPTHGGTTWRTVEGTWSCCWAEGLGRERSPIEEPTDTTEGAG